MKYELSDSMGYLFAVSHWKLHHTLMSKFKESGLGVTPDQWKIMLILLNNGPMFQSRIAEHSMKNRAGVKRLLDQLESAALVERRHSEEDSRANTIYLTDKGMDVVQQLNHHARHILKYAFQDFSEEELTFVKDFLNRFIQQFDESRQG